MIKIILLLIDLCLLFDYHYHKLYLSDIAALLLFFLLSFNLFYKKKIFLKNEDKFIILIAILLSFLIIIMLNFSKIFTILHIILSFLILINLILNKNMFIHNKIFVVNNFKILISIFFITVLTQFIFLNIFHIHLDFSFNFMDIGGQRLFNKSGLLLRSAGLYVEPAHQALILIILLIIANILNFNPKWELLIVISILMTLSSLGMIAIFLWLIFNKKINIKYKFISLFIFLIFFIMFYNTIYYIFIMKIKNITLNYSSGYVRVLGPFMILEKMTLHDLLIGIGYGNIYNFLKLNQLYINVKGLANLGSNSLFHFLVSGGIIHFILYILLIWLLLFKNNLEISTKIFIFLVFLIFDLGGDFSFLPWYWLSVFLIYISIRIKFYESIIYINKLQYKTINKSSN